MKTRLFEESYRWCESSLWKPPLWAFAICAGFMACKPDAPPSQLQEKAAGPPVVSGSRQDYAAQQRAEAQATAVEGARAELQPTQGNKVGGRIELARDQQRVHITGEVTGLSPGEHGFHIHETGDCSDPKAESAGGHFAPHENSHGGPDSDPNSRHAGDFGNITADKDGVAKVDAWGELALLTAGQSFAVGKAFIVHADKDDLKSQPSGNAGARVACGVIQAQDQPVQP